MIGIAILSVLFEGSEAVTSSWCCTLIYSKHVDDTSSVFVISCVRFLTPVGLHTLVVFGGIHASG